MPSESSQDTLAQRKGFNFTIACTGCAAGDRELRRCSKCRRALYCSTECQTKHWPSHKPSCTTADVHDLDELFKNAYNDPVFNRILQALFILHFDLLRFPQVDKPIVAEIELAIEPVKSRDFARIFVGAPLGEKPIMGMLQINAFTPFTRSRVAALTPTRWGVWKHAKDSLNEGAEAARCGGSFAWTDSGNARRRESPPLKLACLTTGEITEQPFNIESCLERLNDYIQADTNNKMGLRTEMLPSDINIIREARAGSNSLAATALRAKMAREKIFKPLIQWMEQHPHTRQG
ncbi:hypothetical protein DFH06DRAFT_1327129 [Mycena polygramma]|nr:hypothetical protein DFH06DRAFT_1327129 [Mycena polygramma]